MSNRYPMQAATVCISDLGMATTLAPNLPDSCAAARAGITRMSEMKILSLSDHESLGQEPIAGCMAQYIPSGFVGFAKALLLGKIALTDLQSRATLDPSGLSRTGVFVNVSDQFYSDCGFNPELEEDRRLPSARWTEKCQQLIPALMKACNLAIYDRNHRLYAGGHTGFVHAIEEAADLLSAGQFDRCLVGGIDSCTEPGFLIGAAAKHVLKTTANPVGFVPGEAAAFVLLERVADAQRRKKMSGILLGTSVLFTGRNRLADDAPNGGALARAIDQALASWYSSTEELAVVISDLNGDEYRARDWGNALARLGAKHRFADVVHWIPALAYGEIGAATVPTALCTSLVAQQRGWLPRGPILQWASADHGSRAAVCFSSAYNG